MILAGGGGVGINSGEDERAIGMSSSRGEREREREVLFSSVVLVADAAVGSAASGGVGAFTATDLHINVLPTVGRLVACGEWNRPHTRHPSSATAHALVVARRGDGGGRRRTDSGATIERARRVALGSVSLLMRILRRELPADLEADLGGG